MRSLLLEPNALWSDTVLWKGTLFDTSTFFHAKSFQIKLILLSQADNMSDFNIQLSNKDFIYKKEKYSTQPGPLWKTH